MAPLSNLLLISAVASASAFAPSTPVTQTARVQTRPAQADTKVFENFGFDFAEDQTENTASVILGEARYKQWVGEVVDPDNSFVNRQVRLGSTQWRHSIGACFTAMKASENGSQWTCALLVDALSSSVLDSVVYIKGTDRAGLVLRPQLSWLSLKSSTRVYPSLIISGLFLFLSISLLLQYNVIRRVRELDLLGQTAELGILSKLEKQGLDLATIESLLPQAEKLGLLSLVANNQQLLINLVAPLLVEPAPLLLPAIAGALDVGPSAFYLAAATLAGTEAFLLVNNVEVPFVGLSAGVLLGLLLVPLTVVTGGLGVALASAGKK
eukprot:CAMPEP_0113570788 /NCGR_PEP_ID=MMETSP0015_2-20120614/25185_1 /TAXON_ID=2838 /ORGANISM="Odontella" /LENGTH=323 /DNA_ID=CAMNT_0000473651 /DNA_START=60 /DNA_END=1032 /DNA_ORIENTATION=+ /assembly_acc=CAM_ASM_000160